MNLEARRRMILELRKSKVSYRRIGGIVGLSRQRVWEIVNGKTPPKILKSSLLTTREAAQMLGVHAGTIRSWDNEGVLHSRRIGPRKDRRFKETEIAMFMGVT